jgi:hypothetical protein
MGLAPQSLHESKLRSPLRFYVLSSQHHDTVLNIVTADLP